MLRFILTTTGSEGNVTSFVRLAVALRERGHEVFLLTHSRFVERFRRSGVRIVPFDTPEQYDAFLSEGSLLNDPRTAAACFRRHFLPRVVDECRLMESLCEPARTVLVTSETPGLSARLVAEKTGAECVSVLLYPAHVVTMTVYEEFLWESFGPDFAGIRPQLGLRPLTHVRSWWRSPGLHVTVWPEWYANVATGSLRRLEYLGFLWQDDAPDEEVAASVAALGMDRDRRVVITGGTGRFGSPAFFTGCLEACGRLGIEPVVVGDGVAAASELDGRATWVMSVPSLARLMNRASLLIHHGGLGTIGQALAAGVPQLVGAAGGDRPHNGMLVERLGAGFYLPRFRWDVEETTAAIARLLAGETAARCDELAGRMQREETRGRALDAMESLAEAAA